MIYLVRAKNSQHYTSINDAAYLTLIDRSSPPWYYDQYERVPWHGEIPPKIPCDLTGKPVPRSSLSPVDKNLYRLHLKAVRAWKISGKPYWMVDGDLTESFEKHWKQVSHD